MAGTFRRHHDHVDIAARYHLVVVDVETVGEGQCGTLFHVRLDVTDSTYVIELTGNGSKLDAFLEAIDRALILETVRTGVSGIGRGDRILKV